MASDPLRRVGPDFLEEYPGADPSATECHVNLCVVADLLLARLGSNLVREAGLSVTAVNVLATLEGAGEPLQPSEIGHRALLTPSSITSVLDTLERRGLVTRSPNPTDRRSVLVSVTADGEAVLDRLLPGIRVLERVAFESLSERERATLLRLLAKVAVGLESEVARAPMPTGGVRNVPDRLRRVRRSRS